MINLRLVLLISIFIFIIYCFNPNIEHFGFFKDISKDAKKIGNTIKKDAKKIGSTIEKDTKIVGKFIVKEGKSLIHGVENFSEEVFKYS